MIVFTRVQARDFKAVFGRCVSGRPRGLAPPVVVRFWGGIRTLAATTPEGVILTHTTAARTERDDQVVLPEAILADVEGGTDDPVAVERQTKLRASVRWSDRDGPHSTTTELSLPGRQHELAEPPALAPISGEFLRALHECGRTAARESGRFALAKIQIQGKAGRLIGTDSRCALLWDGFKLPFPDQLLVPALPVFGSKELVGIGEVRVARTKTYLVVAVDPWAVWLPIDTTSRYPDVAAVVPRTADATVAGIDERDAEVLLGELPKLPGAGEEYRPVTLDLDGGVKVRAADATTKAVHEVYLARSPVAGPGLRVALDRMVLKRILTLGCHTIRLVEGKPLVAIGENCTILAATLDSMLVATPTDAAVRTSTDEAAAGTPQPNHERNTPMKPTPNGHVAPQQSDQPDPLIAAEELRAALAEATAKAARLVAALRAGRKEKKALATVWAGLKQLNLGTPGG